MECEWKSHFSFQAQPITFPKLTSPCCFHILAVWQEWRCHLGRPWNPYIEHDVAFLGLDPWITTWEGYCTDLFIYTVLLHGQPIKVNVVRGVRKFRVNFATIANLIISDTQSLVAYLLVCLFDWLAGSFILIKSWIQMTR